ncbi:AMP-binding protein [Thalassotalea ganghwensis]
MSDFILPSFNVITKTGSFDRQTFLSDVENFRRKVRNALPSGAPEKVLLFDRNIYRFLVRLIALGNEGHTVVLPPNNLPGTLQELKGGLDYFAGDIDIDGKVSLEKVPIGNSPLTQTGWPSEGVLVFFTSGSSGKSKAIIKSWTEITAELEVLVKTFRFEGQINFIATVSHQHIYGLLFRTMLPLKLGCTIYETIEYPEQLSAELANGSNFVLISSPAFLSRLTQDNVIEHQRDKLVYVFSSGGKLDDQDAITLFQQFNIPVTQVYGSTETGGIAYRQQVRANDLQWSFFEGVSCITDEASGRLLLTSPFISQPQLLLDDVGTVACGKLTLMGRIDRTIKLEEKRVNLSHMETVCQQHQWIKQVKLLAIGNKRTVLGAVVQLTKDGQRNLTTEGNRYLVRQLKAHLAQYFELVTLPKKWRFVEVLPYDSQGKLPLVELEKLFV